MRHLATFILASFLVVLAGKAQDTMAVNSPETAFDNLQSSFYANGITNAAATPAVFTNIYVAPALYHTFHFKATNTCSYVIDCSIDNTNWFFGATNALTANVVSEATLTKKENYIRIRLTGTNVGCNINYLGGR